MDSNKSLKEQKIENKKSVSRCGMDIPFISRKQMAKLDELMIEHFGIQVIQMMEHAGKNIAQYAREILGAERNVAVVVGKGNNGGDAAVAARFLHTWGAKIRVIVADERVKDITRKHLKTLEKMDVALLYPDNFEKIKAALKKADLIIDGLFGYNINRDPEGFFAELITMANNSGSMILAIDVPSGLDPDKGAIYNPCIQATHTLTLSLPKKGFLQAREHVGKLALADIGVPPELYTLMGLTVDNLFKERNIIKVW
jgi:hydroxyethylthiazole kinase-like uncharacterized protein yjeF